MPCTFAIRQGLLMLYVSACFFRSPYLCLVVLKIVFFFCLSTSTTLRSIFSAMSCSQCIKMCLFCSSFVGYLPLNLFFRKSIVFISLSTHFGLLKIYCFISFSQRLQIISLQIGHSNYSNIKTISFSPGSTITFFSGWLPFHLVPIQ